MQWFEPSLDKMGPIQVQHLGALGLTKERSDFPFLAAAFRCISRCEGGSEERKNPIFPWSARAPQCCTFQIHRPHAESKPGSSGVASDLICSPKSAIRFLFTNSSGWKGDLQPFLCLGAGAAGALCLATTVSIASPGFLGRSGRGSTAHTIKLAPAKARMPHSCWGFCRDGASIKRHPIDCGAHPAHLAELTRTALPNHAIAGRSCPRSKPPPACLWSALRPNLLARNSKSRIRL